MKLIGLVVKRLREKIIVSMYLKMAHILIILRQESLLVVNVDMVAL